MTTGLLTVGAGSAEGTVAIGNVTAIGNSSSASVTSQTITTNRDVPVGALLVVTSVSNNSSVQITSCGDDSGSNTWTILDALTGTRRSAEVLRSAIEEGERIQISWKEEDVQLLRS